VRYCGNYSAHLATAHRGAPDRGRTDNEKMGYGHRAGRVQSQISRQVRNATRRLKELERIRAPEPPPPLRFAAGELAACSEEGPLPLVSLIEVRVQVGSRQPAWRCRRATGCCSRYAPDGCRPRARAYAGAD
jgi:hypothetical protein